MALYALFCGYPGAPIHSTGCYETQNVATCACKKLKAGGGTCNKLVVKIHASIFRGVKKIDHVDLGEKHVKHGHVEGAKCGTMTKIPKISVLWWVL